MGSGYVCHGGKWKNSVVVLGYVLGVKEGEMEEIRVGERKEEGGKEEEISKKIMVVGGKWWVAVAGGVGREGEKERRKRTKEKSREKEEEVGSFVGG